METVFSIFGFIVAVAILLGIVAIADVATPEECKKCRFYGTCRDFTDKYHYPPCVIPTNKNR